MQVSHDLNMNILFLEYLRVLFVHILKWTCRGYIPRTCQKGSPNVHTAIYLPLSDFELAAEEISFTFVSDCFFGFSLVCACQPEERAQFEMLKSQMYAERAAKRDRKPKRARAVPEDEPKNTG